VSLGLALVATGPARADDRFALPANETWKKECGTCHLPYPPQLLPARSWQAVMAGLDRHFGSDASLDPKVAAEVAAVLARHAGRDRGGPTAIRITETSWFRREHQEVPPAVWRRAEVKSPANCAACHAAAERGDFDEDAVRLPR
jgi:hypothetical protein